MAAEKEERFTGRQFRGLDFPEEDGVVTGDVRGYYAANDLGEGVFEEREAGRGPAIADAQLCIGFRGLVGLGKIDGDGLLVFLQHIYGENALLLYERQKVAALIHADENQERFERDRGQGVGSHAVSLAGGAFDGDNRDAGGELAECVAKVS